MKKFFNSKTIPFIVLLCAVPGLALRLWAYGGGPDENGLFEFHALPWTLLFVLTAAVFVMIILSRKELSVAGTYEENFPKSIAAALLSIPAALCFAFYGVVQLRQSLLMVSPDVTIVDTITGIAGILAGICLFITAAYRALGKKPFFVCHAMVALYLAVSLFNRCQQWDNITQMSRFIFPLLACVTLLLAGYHRACFDVDMGSRKTYLLWCLMSVYLCLVSMIGSDIPVYFGCCALWMIGSICATGALEPREEISELSEPEGADEQ